MPYGPRPSAPAAALRRVAMSTADAVAAVLWVGVDVLRGVRRGRLRRRLLGAAGRAAASGASARAS